MEFCRRQLVLLQGSGSARALEVWFSLLELSAGASSIFRRWNVPSTLKLCDTLGWGWDSCIEYTNA